MKRSMIAILSSYYEVFRYYFDIPCFQVLQTVMWTARDNSHCEHGDLYFLMSFLKQSFVGNIWGIVRQPFFWWITLAVWPCTAFGPEMHDPHTLNYYQIEGKRWAGPLWGNTHTSAIQRSNQKVEKRAWKLGYYSFCKRCYYAVAGEKYHRANHR